MKNFITTFLSGLILIIIFLPLVLIIGAGPIMLANKTGNPWWLLLYTVAVAFVFALATYEDNKF